MVTVFSSARTTAPSDACERPDDEAGVVAITNKYKKYRVVHQTKPFAIAYMLSVITLPNTE